MSRIIAQRIKTGEFLHWDVPLGPDAKHTRELSGPGGITGQIAHKARHLLGDDGLPIFREWSTALFYEAGGTIRNGGIVTRITETPDGAYQIEAPGFSTYPHGIPYEGRYRPGLGADPLDAYRHLWQHVQSFPDGNLGVTVDDTTSTATLDDTSGEKVKPYALSWWDNKDCGTEMASLLDLAPADYIEDHGWNDDHTAIEHRIRLGVPRLGRKRHDLRFAEGENIIQPLPRLIDGDDFAQEVVGLGKGEGRRMVRHRAAKRDDRLRRVATVVDKSAHQGRIEELVRRELKRRDDTEGYSQIIVRDHPNARLSAIDPGDDILVLAEHPWYGRKRTWVRVVSVEQTIAADDVATLNVARSDEFAY